MEDNQKYWIAFNLIFARDLKLAKKVYDHFPSVRDVFHADKGDLISSGLTKEKIAKITSSRILEEALREIERIEKRNFRLITLEDESYPGYLREIFDPPFVLYCAGNVEVLEETSVSIVGSRRPSTYGRAVAEKLAEDLASRGVVVVSGLARGIDTLAHWGALNGGKTVAVLGSGLENVYPRENASLFKKIVEKGAVISEFPLDALPLSYHFPIRNRIISGLSLATIIIEAAKRSGSLISARLALEQNREVMAVPGNVTSDLSQGTNWLIKNGAKLVADWEDVVEELPLPIKEELLSQKEKKKSRPSLKSEEKEIFELLKEDSLTHIDQLVEQSEFSVSEVLSILLNLELKDYISQHPGKYFLRRM